MNIVPLFPTPIAKFSNFITSEERVKLYLRIKKRKHHRFGAIVGDGFSTYSETKKAPEVVDNNIKKRIQNAVNEYNKEYGAKPCKISNMWSNIQNKGSTLNEHTHTSSIISGGLYIKVDETCKLTFHNPNPYIGVMEKWKEDTYYNIDFYWIPVENCQLVLFPGWLKHGKYTDEIEMDERIVIGFDCVLCS